jgi:hypothetical protein
MPLPENLVLEQKRSMSARRAAVQLAQHKIKQFEVAVGMATKVIIGFGLLGLICLPRWGPAVVAVIYVPVSALICAALSTIGAFAIHHSHPTLAWEELLIIAIGKPLATVGYILAALGLRCLIGSLG